MFGALVTLLCAQTVFPATGPGIEVGSAQAQPYPANTGSIAWKSDGGLGVVWLDTRRSLGSLDTGADLWTANLVAGVSEPAEKTGVLLVDAPVGVTLESPGIAFNAGRRAVVWLERSATSSTVQLDLGPEDSVGPLRPIAGGLSTSSGVTNVSVSAAGRGFIVAWSDATQISSVRVDTTGAPTVPVNTQILGVQAASRVLVAGLGDGGAAFAYSTGPAPRAGFFTHDSISPTSDAGSFFDTSGALAGIGFHGGTASLLLRNPAGDLLNRTLALGFTSVVSTRALSECVVGGNETLTALAYVDTATVSQVGFISSSGAVRVLEAPTAEAVAVAANSTHGAYLRRVSGLSVLTRPVASTSLEPPTELNRAQPTQRGPSVAWLPDAGGFLLAFEERAPLQSPGMLIESWQSRFALISPDGGAFTATQFATGALPRIVEWADDAFGLEDQGLLDRSHRVVTSQGVPAPRSTFAGLTWRSSAGPPLLVWRPAGAGRTELSGSSITGQLPISSPRCGAAVNGLHALAGWRGNELALYQLGAGATPTITSLSTNLLSQGSVCVTRGRAPTELLATWTESDVIRVQPIGSPGATGFTLSLAARTLLAENPVATRLGSGVLVVWETPPSYAELGAAFIDDSNPALPRFLTLGTGTDLVRNPAVTSANGKVAVVAWQEFDRTPGVGATRVRARLVFPPPVAMADAGVDAGTGGSRDAGLPDAGDMDASVPDAGERDGGMVASDDAGMTGVPVTLEFVPTCGCSVSPSAGLLVLLGVLAARRRAAARQPVGHALRNERETTALIS